MSEKVRDEIDMKEELSDEDLREISGGAARGGLLSNMGRVLVGDKKEQAANEEADVLDPQILLDSGVKPVISANTVKRK